MAAFETRLAMEVTQIPKRVLSAIFKADIFVAPRLIVSSLLNDHCPYTHPFLLLHFTAHRFLSRPTAFYHCPPLPITSFHCPPLPITSFHCPPLPISAYRLLSLPTASYHLLEFGVQYCVSPRYICVTDIFNNSFVLFSS